MLSFQHATARVSLRATPSRPALLPHTSYTVMAKRELETGARARFLSLLSHSQCAAPLSPPPSQAAATLPPLTPHTIAVCALLHAYLVADSEDGEVSEGRDSQTASRAARALFLNLAPALLPPSRPRLLSPTAAAAP